MRRSKKELLKGKQSMEQHPSSLKKRKIKAE